MRVGDGETWHHECWRTGLTLDVPRGEPCPECGSWERAASVQGGVVLEHGPGHGCFGCLAWRPTTSVRMYCGAHPERRLPNDAPTQAPSWCPLRQENGGVVTVRGRRGS